MGYEGGVSLRLSTDILVVYHASLLLCDAASRTDTEYEGPGQKYGEYRANV
jgi:hypothetical protein